MDCSPATLVALAKCFSCLSDKRIQKLKVMLLCLIAQKLP